MAERELSAAMLAACTATTIRPVIFYEGEFYATGSPDSQYLRLFTGIGQIVWDGKTWTGGGQLLTISSIKETKSLEAVGWKVSVSGLPTANRSLALQSMRKNRPGRLWLGLYDADGNLLADPYELRRGRFDQAPISRDGNTMTIEARYEDRLVDFERPREFYYTSEDQKLRLAGDKGFDQVPELQNANDVWGAAPS